MFYFSTILKRRWSIELEFSDFGIKIPLNIARPFLSENGKFVQTMDIILEEFSQIHHPNLLRYDLESYIEGHRGIFFQDRDKFPTTI